MDIFSQFLASRDATKDREKRSSDWLDLNAPLAPPERLLKFDTWTRRLLAERLEWPKEPARRASQIEQCRQLVEGMVIDLWRRGWMLDGARLSAHILRAVGDVAKAQTQGSVRDLYAYLRRSLQAYVGANAEEIHAESKRHASGHVGTLAAGLLAGYGIKREGPSIPELVAQRRAEIADAKKAKTLRQQLAQARGRKAACNDVAGQQKLF